MREYQRLARSMIAREPGNPKYRLEQSYANTNLGVLVLEQRKYREASRIFGSELAASEALLASEPGNAAYQDRFVEALAWLADAREKSGEIDDAIAQRERQLTLMRQLAGTRKDDAVLKRKVMTAERAAGRLFASKGETRVGLEHAQRAAAVGDELMKIEPNNTEWAQYAADGRLELAELQLALGDSAGAGASARAGCDMASRLVERDSSVDLWRAGLRGRCLNLRGRLALARNAPLEAQALAESSVRLARAELRRTRTPDTQFALADAEMLRGDVAARLGNRSSAQAAWKAALGAWPQGIEEQPRQQAMRAYLLRKVGQAAEAGAIERELASIGYRHPEFWRS